MSVRRLIITLAAGLAAMACAMAFTAPSALAAVAANGSFIRVTGTDPIYEVVGGAVIHIDSCSTLTGCSKPTAVSSLSGYASVPANGSFVEFSGGIYEVVGGALIHVDSCAILKCSGTLKLDPGGAADYVKAHPTPTAGTLIKSVGSTSPAAGWVGEVLGTAVIHVDACAGLSGSSCAGDVSLDSGGLADYMAAHPVPVDGTFIRSGSGADAGYVDEVIGGALIHVGSCAPLNGCLGDETLDGGGFADYISAHPLPANGTFIRDADGPQAGLIARVAGGAFLTISDCASLGGCPSTIDSLDSSGFAAWSSAHAVPVDGTYLLGLPSNTTWEVMGGQRQTASASTSAVPVDDSSLNTVPQPPAPTTTTTTTAPISSTPPAPTTVTPPKSISKAKNVKLAISFGWRWKGARSQLVWVRAPALKRPLRLSATCVGKGCPYRTRTWRRGTAKKFLSQLRGGIYRAGDKLTLTISRSGYRSERMTLTVRNGRAPKPALLRTRR